VAQKKLFTSHNYYGTTAAQRELKLVKFLQQAIASNK
jgi:hypothetical protein